MRASRRISARTPSPRSRRIVPCCFFTSGRLGLAFLLRAESLYRLYGRTAEFSPFLPTKQRNNERSRALGNIFFRVAAGQFCYQAAYNRPLTR